MGVERWFERKHSHLRGEANFHVDPSHFSVAAVAVRHRRAARGRIAASSAVSCTMGALALMRVSNKKGRHSSAFHGLPTPDALKLPHIKVEVRQSPTHRPKRATRSSSIPVPLAKIGQIWMNFAQAR